MYTALQDITIEKIDFDWIKSTVKPSHLKRAIKVIEVDGNYYPQLKQACYQRLQQIDPSQKRVKVTNELSLQEKHQIENQLLEWQIGFQNKNAKQQKLMHPSKELEDIQSYFSNDEKVQDAQMKTKLAESERVKGNQAIKSKDFKQAIGYYTSSIGFDSQMHQSYCNRALAYLKIKQYQKCIQDCESTLKIQKNSTKAYHRKAQALMGLSIFEEKKVQAYRCLQQAQKIQPQNGQITKQLKQLRQQMSQEQIKQLDSHLIPKSQFKKIVIEEDSDEDE